MRTWYMIVNIETGVYAGAISGVGTPGYNRASLWCFDIQRKGKHVAPVEFDAIDGGIEDIRIINREHATVTPKHRGEVNKQIDPSPSF